MTPRKILYIVIAAAVLLAILIAISGPYGTEAELHDDFLPESLPESGMEDLEIEDEQYAVVEEYTVNDDLISAEISGTSVTLHYVPPVTDSYISDFFRREDAKYGLESAGITYSFPASGMIRIEFPEIATPRRIARWLGIWMDDLGEYGGK